MSITLFSAAFVAVVAVLVATVRQCFPTLWVRLDRAVFGPPEVDVPPMAEPLRPEHVPQHQAAAAADPCQLTRDERDLFELAVAVYRAGRLVDARPKESR